jgi:hypothetical protein
MRPLIIPRLDKNRHMNADNGCPILLLKLGDFALAFVYDSNPQYLVEKLEKKRLPL